MNTGWQDRVPSATADGAMSKSAPTSPSNISQRVKHWLEKGRTFNSNTAEKEAVEASGAPDSPTLELVISQGPKTGPSPQLSPMAIDREFPALPSIPPVDRYSNLADNGEKGDIDVVFQPTGDPELASKFGYRINFPPIHHASFRSESLLSNFIKITKRNSVKCIFLGEAFDRERI